MEIERTAAEATGGTAHNAFLWGPLTAATFLMVLQDVTTWALTHFEPVRAWSVAEDFTPTEEQEGYGLIGRGQRMTASGYRSNQLTRCLRSITNPKVRGAALWSAHALLATCHTPASDRSSGATPQDRQRKLSALSSLYEFLTNQNAVSSNPVKGVKRPKVDSYEGKTPAIADKEARQLMNLPSDKSLKGLRDRALLDTLLYHGLRREELCRLKIKDIHPRRGVPHLRVHGKGDKTRYIPLHAGTQELLNDYLDEARHAADTEGALFRPVANNRTGRLDKTITPDGVYKLVRRYALALGLKIGAHALRATAATNALDHDADIAKVQEWLGHANIATTRIYDRRKMKPEDSPTFKVRY